MKYVAINNIVRLCLFMFVFIVAICVMNRKTKTRPLQKIDPSSLLLVNDSGLHFFAGTIHHNWVMLNERHVMFALKNAIENCRKESGTCIMIDVGMNDGFFSQMAASLGAKVWSFELQPRCIEIAMNATVANHFEDTITVINRPVSAFHNQLMTVPHSTTVCSGIFNLGRTDCPQCPRFDKQEGFEKRSYYSIALDSMFPAPFTIDFMKIDVEGHEPQVLQGAEQLFMDHRVKVLSLESQPKMWSTLNEHEQRHDAVYRRILSYGYNFQCADITSPVYDKSQAKEFLLFLHKNQCTDWKVFIA